MLVIAALGVILFFLSVGRGDEDWILWLPFVAYAITLGARTHRMGVFADTAGITIRNRWRTRMVKWDDVASLQYERLWAGWGLFILSLGRWCGVLRTKGGREIHMEVTTALSPPFGFLFSGSRSRGDAFVRQLAVLWHAYLGNTSPNALD